MSKNRAAVELGRKGGKSRARSLSARERREIAAKAAIARWHGHAPAKGVSAVKRRTEANTLLEVVKAAEPLLKHTCTATSDIHDCVRCRAIQAIFRMEGE